MADQSVGVDEDVGVVKFAAVDYFAFAVAASADMELQFPVIRQFVVGIEGTDEGYTLCFFYFVRHSFL